MYALPLRASSLGAAHYNGVKSGDGAKSGVCLVQLAMEVVEAIEQLPRNLGELVFVRQPARRCVLLDQIFDRPPVHHLQHRVHLPPQRERHVCPSSTASAENACGE